MNNRSFDDGLTYFFNRRIHDRDLSNNRPGLEEPESEWDEPENLLEDILRWADDGGPMLDLGNPRPGANPDAAVKQANE